MLQRAVCCVATGCAALSEGADRCVDRQSDGIMLSRRGDKRWLGGGGGCLDLAGSQITDETCLEETTEIPYVEHNRVSGARGLSRIGLSVLKL
jgi:hypothetical protein